MDAGTTQLQGHPNRMLCARVVLDRAAAWTRLGVRVTQKSGTTAGEVRVGRPFGARWRSPVRGSAR
jgi:hypothetical protein